ncbi:hypothetical protein ACFO4L_14075 [Bacillus daqingensis]|uniref:Uncharacterized protein n=1 Tax=Bacillus daqingensis TaxID=872396 RepID=A0ABV9NWG4_9BACI
MNVNVSTKKAAASSDWDVFLYKQIHFPFVSGVPLEAVQPEDAVPFRSVNGIHARAEPDYVLKASREEPVSE